MIKRLFTSAKISLTRWKLLLFRASIYSCVVGWGMFRGGTQGYDRLSDMTSLQQIYLFGDIIFSGIFGVILAFIDNTLAGLMKPDNPQTSKPEQEPSPTP